METTLTKSDWRAQMTLVKDMVARGASDDEFKLMCHIASKYELDPLAKQIWVVKYGDRPASIFTGRDGFLSIAHRTNQFGGMETKIEKVAEPIDVFHTRWVNSKQVKIEVKREWQYKATCTVHRKDAEFPFISEVYEEEYTTGENLWKSKPRTMIGKVAESQCLRKAFNISGINSEEELASQEIDITEKPNIPDIIKNVPEEIMKAFSKLRKPDMTDELFHIGIAKVYEANQGDIEGVKAFLTEKGAM